jgi:hypothetical protein
LADSLGNGDWMITGFERDIASTLESLDVGAVCWLGTTIDPARASRLSLFRIFDHVCDLDCGAQSRGVPPASRPYWIAGRCRSGLAIERADVGRWRLGTELVDLAGEVGRPEIYGPAPEIGAELTYDQEVERIREELADVAPECLEELAPRVEALRATLDTGDCPVAEVQARNRGLGEAHAPADHACPRGWGLMAALDLVALRHCPIDGPAEEVVALFDWLDNRAEFGSQRWVIGLPDGVATQREARDLTRLVSVGEQLRARGALDRDRTVSLVNALARVPLNLRADTLAELLEQEPALLEEGVLGELGPEVLLFLIDRERFEEARLLAEAHGLNQPQPLLYVPENNPHFQVLEQVGESCRNRVSAQAQ